MFDLFIWRCTAGGHFFCFLCVFLRDYALFIPDMASIEDISDSGSEYIPDESENESTDEEFPSETSDLDDCASRHFW